MSLPTQRGFKRVRRPFSGARSRTAARSPTSVRIRGGTSKNAMPVPGAFKDLSALRIILVLFPALRLSRFEESP